MTPPNIPNHPPAASDHPASLAESYLEIACDNLPVVNQALRDYGTTSLSAYLPTLLSDAYPSYQPRDDLLTVVYQYAASLLGSPIASRAVEDLARHPVVLTNHHGVDYFSQSVQGSLLFALPRLCGSLRATTVPVFSCGIVPLRSLTYPRGLLIYQGNDHTIERLPRRLPLFSKQFRTKMVSAVPAFDTRMVNKAEKRSHRMMKTGQIASRLAPTFQTIFQEDYRAEPVTTLPSYSDQSVVVNARMWRRLFAELSNVPELVYLEQENIVAALLEADVANPRSLAWGVLFDPKLRESILEALDGLPGCW
ncbi:hypothetical protein GF339_21110, partial [candidate division KSB3 bacterium]|nr:hypothetical protein [candidate division KSB3 bacterium]MBD3327100.1 hypothetical protein [candidate division KSB3 bacterium]